MTYAAAPIEHLARRRLWLGLEFRSPIAERVERNPASLAILTLIELARDPLTLNSLIPAKNYLFFEVFSLLICVGNCPKNDCSAAVSCCKIGLGSPEIAKFPVKFPVAGNLRGDGCDRHCVASQPVRCSEILPSTMLEMPANGGLLQIGGPSPDSKFRYFQGQIADSLRRISEIFPFLGDGGWRPGSICTAWPSLQWNVANSPPWRPAVGNNAKTDHFKPGISSRTRSMAGCARSPPSRGGRSAVATAERSTPRTSETA